MNTETTADRRARIDRQWAAKVAADAERRLRTATPPFTVSHPRHTR